MEAKHGDVVEQIGRFIHGTILEDEPSNALGVPGSCFLRPDAFSFVVEMNPEGWSGGDRRVRVTVEVLDDAAEGQSNG